MCCVFTAMIEAAKTIGTRGGALVTKIQLTGKSMFEIDIKDKSLFDKKRVISYKDDNGISSEMIDVTPIPNPDLWFENVWNEYMKRLKL